MNPSPRSVTTTGPGDRRARLVLPALLLVLAWACGAPRERFSGTHDSPEALTETFLWALESEDRSRLEALALSEREYRLEVFPEMPVYGDIPPDFAWSQLAGRNVYGVSFVLDRHGGRTWDLERIEFEGGRTVYQTFVVHRDPMLHLRDRDTDEEEELVFFGSVLEHDGRFKLLSFNIDR
jgi:hypothetical protein